MFPPPFSRALHLAASLLVPVLFTQCKSTTSSYRDVKYDPSKLKTPTGHGMERKDYPFDEQGTYRKDWVKSNSSGRDGSASSRAAQTEVAEAAATTTGSSSYPTYAEASASRGNGAFVGPADGSGAPVVALSSAPADSAPSPTYHKVSSGDTLFSISNRYKTSVSDLKRVNGLTSDSIRVGQSLRIP